MKKIIKRKNKILTAIVIIAMLVFMLCSCSNESQSQTNTFYDFMGTSVNVVIYADCDFFWQKDKLNACYDEITAMLNSLDAVFSVENENSIVYKFNQCKKGESVVTDAEFDTIYNLAVDMYTSSNGAFNPSVKPLIDLWAFSKKYTLDNYQPITAFDRVRNEDNSFNLPNEKFITAFSGLAKFTNILQNNCITKNVDDVIVDNVTYSSQIDLSGVVKGYATDKIKEIIINNGYTDFYVSIGTSSMYLSSQDGESFDLAVTDPNDIDNSGCCSVKVKDKFVSTSGTYENFYKLGGVNYHHIIDSNIGAPAKTDIISATVFGSSGAKADALSTAVVVLGKDGGIELLKSQGYNYIIITNDNKIFTDMGDDFSLMNELYAVSSL